MGKTQSQHSHENQSRGQSEALSPASQNKYKRKWGFFNRKNSTSIPIINLSNAAEAQSPPVLYDQPSYIGQPSMYSSAPVLSVNPYNNFPIASYLTPSSMMMQPTRMAAIMPPSNVVSMPVFSPSTPPLSYGQRPQTYSMYNMMPASGPTSIPVVGGNILNPLPYPSSPYRLVTDWTKGGKISPGFLGPPI